MHRSFFENSIKSYNHLKTSLISHSKPRRQIFFSEFEPRLMSTPIYVYSEKKKIPFEIHFGGPQRITLTNSRNFHSVDSRILSVFISRKSNGPITNLVTSTLVETS